MAEKASYVERRDSLRNSHDSGLVLLYQDMNRSPNTSYLTGMKNSQGYALFSLDGKEEYVITNKISEGNVKKESDIKKIVISNDFDEEIDRLIGELGYGKKKIFGGNKIYVDKNENGLPLKQYERLTEKYGGLKDISESVESKRTTKDEYEIGCIEKSSKVASLAMKKAMKKARAGEKEKTVENEAVYEMLKNGAQGESFDTIVGSGKNGTNPHYSDNKDIIGKDVPVVIDLGSRVDDYASDMTRTVPSGKKFTEEQEKIYGVVLEAQEKTIEAVSEGVTLRELDNIAQRSMLAGLEKILGRAVSYEELRKYYPHGIGHSVGLEVHDPGIGWDNELKEGQVITVEPGLYFEKKGIGFRIEDTILVKKEGAEILTNAPKKLKELYKFIEKERESAEEVI